MAPGNSVADMNEFLGKHLTSKLAADQFVPKSFLGDKPAPKVAQSDEGIVPKTAPEMPLPKEEPKPKAKPVIVKKRIQNGSKTLEYSWQLLPDGEYNYLGKTILSSDSRNEVLPAEGEEDEKSDEPKTDEKANPFRVGA